MSLGIAFLLFLIRHVDSMIICWLKKLRKGVVIFFLVPYQQALFFIVDQQRLLSL